jgi:hypothetical protein
MFLKAADVRIRIGLDANAQTRVDLAIASRTERGDLGRARRTVGAFLARLDQVLSAGPHQILDASTGPSGLDAS